LRQTHLRHKKKKRGEEVEQGGMIGLEDSRGIPFPSVLKREYNVYGSKKNSSQKGKRKRRGGKKRP